MASRVSLDRIDRLLLTQLETNGRATLPELADAVRLSPSACQRRLRRLESEKIIRGYRAVLEPTAVGRSLVAYLSVILTDHAAATVAAFERAIVNLDFVTSCHHVTGDADYLVRIDVADIGELDIVTRQRLADVPGVGRYTTHVCTSVIVDRMTEVDAPHHGG